MTDRGLKIALAVSVALNVFVGGAVAGGLIVGGRFLAERGRPDRPSAMAVVGSLDAPVREAAIQSLREAGLEARPAFETAREARRRAIELAGAETFDRPAVEAALVQSRQAELAGRSRVEGAVLDVMAPLDRAERRRLAPALARHGRGGRGERGRGRLDRDGRSERPSEAQAASD